MFDPVLRQGHTPAQPLTPLPAGVDSDCWRYVAIVLAHRLTSTFGRSAPGCSPHAIELSRPKKDQRDDRLRTASQRQRTAPRAWRDSKLDERAEPSAQRT